jgi:hypothetical protein
VVVVVAVAAVVSKATVNKLDEMLNAFTERFWVAVAIVQA